MRQFNSVKALIAVSGSTCGRLLLATNGIITEVFAYDEPKLTYSDNEGRFVQRGTTGTFAVGAVNETHPEQRHERFADMFARAIVNVARNIDVGELYLCAPHQTLPMLERRLPYTVRRHIYAEVPANLARMHPLRVLARVASVEARERPYTDHVSATRSERRIAAARNGADPLARHRLDRVLVQARWSNERA